MKKEGYNIWQHQDEAEVISDGNHDMDGEDDDDIAPIQRGKLRVVSSQKSTPPREHHPQSHRGGPS
jgi:hypothetical protein